MTSKKHRHIMIDIETLGNTPTAPVVQIGLVCFENPTSEEYTEVGSFSRNIYFNSALSYGEPNGDTLEWWLGQSDEARKSITKESGEKPVALKQALEDMSQFIKQCKGEYKNKSYEYSTEFWGHATFDIPILNNACDKTWVKTPFYYRANRDLRTIESIFEIVTGKKYEWFERDGVYHRAEDDARHQAKNLHNMLFLLTNIGVKTLDKE